MTALRELAERWHRYADKMYRAEPRNRVREFAAELLAILDAEGDGGAVAWMTHHDNPMLFLSREEASSYCDDDELPIPLYTHPARSGVVRDEDVDGFIEALKNKGLELIFEEDRPYIRAALEHFAKGERHE